MIYLYNFNKINKDKYIPSIHYMPFDETHGLKETREELEEKGFFIESLPPIEDIEGKVPTLYCNPHTKEIWNEYEESISNPNTEMDKDKKIKELEEKIELMQKAIDGLLLGGK